MLSVNLIAATIAQTKWLLWGFSFASMCTHETRHCAWCVKCARNYCDSRTRSVLTLCSHDTLHTVTGNLLLTVWSKTFLPTLLKYLQLQYFSPLTACCWCRNSSWIVFSNFHLICVLWNWREDESFLVSSEKCFQYLNIQKKNIC